jgi:hypothetical protein
MLIPQSTILDWADKIRKHGEMQMASTGKKFRKGTEYEHLCHPGTDTRDPSRDPSKVSRSANEWRLDKSESSIFIGVSSGSRHLNGSAVIHQQYIHIDIHTPDGRQYCEVCLSMDQFASALVGQTHVPCTMNSYWDVRPDNVLLTEVVKEPATISDRVGQRLDNRLNEIVGNLSGPIQILKDQIAGGKPLPKGKQQELLDAFEGLQLRLKNNTEFVLEQAEEEIAQITETAAIWMAHAHQSGLEGADQIAANTPLGALLLSSKGSRVKQIENKPVE